VAVGRQRFCSTSCRQTAWRRRSTAPAVPVVAKADIVYACDECGNRFLGEQRCADCNRWCRRVGPGGCCPNCDEQIAVTDLMDPEHFNVREVRLKKRTT